MCQDVAGSEKYTENSPCDGRYLRETATFCWTKTEAKLVELYILSWLWSSFAPA